MDQKQDKRSYSNILQGDAYYSQPTFQKTFIPFGLGIILILKMTELRQMSASL